MVGSCVLNDLSQPGSADHFLDDFDQAIRIKRFHQPSCGARRAARLLISTQS